MLNLVQITKTTMLLIFILAFAITAKAEDKQYLFNTIEFKSTNFKSLPKWVTILEKMVIEKENINKCHKSKEDCSSDFIAEWLEFFAKARKIKDKHQQIAMVNSFFNDWAYILDIDNWGVSDYWEVPTEFLEFSGDCEDYAIIKYYTLKALGFDKKNMRIVVVKDVVRNGAHAVLAVYQDDKIYILDNLSTQPLPDKVLTQYVPYYSINEDHKWIHFKKLS